MNIRNLSRIIAVFAIGTILAGAALAQSGYKLSQAYTHKNLTIFLIHGKDQNTKGNIITLQEAMERKLLIVYETSEVNELQVENVSRELDVFIQSGDIVKGGKQDRVLAVSIIIPARSGRVKIDSFCVESGRWEKRGGEDSTKFTSSNERIVSRDLKIAANATRSQQEVWAEVSKAQDKLAQNVGGNVQGSSRTSLQLTLEDRKVVANIDDYVKALSSAPNGKSDVIGYAFAINGKINSADVYVSNALFKKVWAKNLKATATEAVSEARGVRLAETVKADAIKDFMDDSEKARAKERAAGPSSRVITREDKDNVLVDAVDEKSKAIVHRNYVKKN
jgi:hypothetical protein